MTRSMIRKCLLGCFALVVVISATAKCELYNWSESAPDPRWWDGEDNWSPIGVPTIIDDVHINMPTGDEPRLYYAIRDGECQKLYLGSSSRGDLFLKGGILTVDKFINIGFVSNRSLLRLEGSAVVNVGQYLNIGVADGSKGRIVIKHSAQLNIGGTLFVPNHYNSEAEILLDDGFISADSLNMNQGDGWIDVHDGFITLNGNQLNLVDSYIEAGKITAFNGLGIVESWYSPINGGKTFIQARTKKATDPNPVDMRSFVDNQLDLTWTIGYGAFYNKVYFGTDELAVSDATTNSREYMGIYHDEIFSTDDYDPNGLLEGCTYFWRIDSEALGASTKGDTWRFVTGRQIESDTWVCTDGADRDLPDINQCGPIKDNKYVGVFYHLWHGEHGRLGPYDVTEIEEHGLDWGPLMAWHHWGQSELGYYLSSDEYVIRKHAHMLANAGVDVIIFDTSNGFTYRDRYHQLCEIYRDIRQQGNNTPKIAFLAPFWYNPDEIVTVVHALYDDLYSKNEFSELWFTWDGKPLILADPELIETGPVKTFFTYRKPNPSLHLGPADSNEWGWCSIYPQSIYYDSEENQEEITVSPAQSFSNETNYNCAMNYPNQVRGRHFHSGMWEPGTDAVLYGYNYQEQWSRALLVNPEFIFITGWGEWVSMRQPHWNGWYPADQAAFPDNFNQWFSRCIEPMNGGHTDNYYYQTVANIRLYKGVNELETITSPDAITINTTGLPNFSEWDSVNPEFRDVIGDTTFRNSQGWDNETLYTNYTGRNDFASLKVGYDAQKIYFYASTAAAISNHDEPLHTKWMLIFIDADKDHSTGWEGYDYVINMPDIISATQTSLKQNVGGGWNWQIVNANVPMRYSGNQIELGILRSDIGMDAPLNVTFDFHWADNIIVEGDISEFAKSGDSAPDRRCNYRYTSSE